MTDFKQTTKSPSFYITTAIDYPNGHPHLGHAYEKIITDFYNLFYKKIGYQTYFLTGVDENGQKLQETALTKKMKTQDFVDQNAEIFKTFAKDLKISNDDFIRTTEDRHAEVAKSFWQKLEQKGDLYFGKYSGLYCINCENFYTEIQAPNGTCPDHQTPLSLKEEDGYFFKISKYEKWITDYIKNTNDFIVPENSKKELLSRLEKEPIRDIAFSRPNNGWGIPVPGNDNFVMYTWCDALVNYYSALVDKNLVETYWPCDMHVIGKDILWFHGIIWPCMLKAIDLELPKQIYVHGMILGQDGRKMSKSLGNGVDPQEMLKKYPLDSFRYYLLRNIPATNDGAFVEKELVDRHNNELGNDLGNLLMRVIKIYLKHCSSSIESTSQELFPEKDLNKVVELVKNREHNKSIDKIWESVTRCNQYINKEKPWDHTENTQRFNTIIYNCIYSLDFVANLLSPVMPSISQKIIKTIGRKSHDNIFELKFGATYHLSNPNILFEKIEFKKEINLFMIDCDQQFQKTILNDLAKFKVIIHNIDDCSKAIQLLDDGLTAHFVIANDQMVSIMELTNYLLEKRLKIPQLIISKDPEQYKKFKKMKFIKSCSNGDTKAIETNFNLLVKRL